MCVCVCVCVCECIYTSKIQKKTKSPTPAPKTHMCLPSLVMEVLVVVAGVNVAGDIARSLSLIASSTTRFSSALLLLSVSDVSFSFS